MAHDDEILWPHGEHKSSVEQLFTLTKELADVKTKEQIALLEKQYEEKRKIAESNGDLAELRDMSEAVLDGRLGEICQRHMLAGKKFPVAYAWPALLAVASALVPRYTERQRLNLYVALVGPLHSGKSQAIEAAQRLLSVEPPVLMSILAGSAEALVRKCKDAAGAPRLFSPDELGHLLEKSRIENASFPYILNRAFYETKFDIHMGRKEVAEFNASMSILGGLPDQRFEDLFSHATTGGLYDRFAYGACPGGFDFEYFPFEVMAQSFKLPAVYVHEDVWIEKAAWRAEDRELEPRVVEIALRAAVVCASFNGETLLTAKQLGPARAFVDYQQRIRRYLKPNEGENIDGKIGLKLMNYLARLGGKYATRRKLLNDIGAIRYGLPAVNRVMDVLFSNGDIEITRTRPVLVRKILEEEQDAKGA